MLYPEDSDMKRQRQSRFMRFTRGLLYTAACGTFALYNTASARTYIKLPSTHFGKSAPFKTGGLEEHDRYHDHDHGGEGRGQIRVDAQGVYFAGCEENAVEGREACYAYQPGVESWTLFVFFPSYPGIAVSFTKRFDGPGVQIATVPAPSVFTDTGDDDDGNGGGDIAFQNPDIEDRSTPTMRPPEGEIAEETPGGGSTGGGISDTGAGDGAMPDTDDGDDFSFDDLPAGDGGDSASGGTVPEPDTSGPYCETEATLDETGQITTENIYHPTEGEGPREVEVYNGTVYGINYKVKIETSIDADTRKELAEYSRVWVSRMPSIVFLEVQPGRPEGAPVVHWHAGGNEYVEAGWDGVHLFEHFMPFLEPENVSPPEYGGENAGGRSNGRDHYEHTFYHEMAHVYSIGAIQRDWPQAENSDGNAVTYYSSAGTVEDFAEFFMVYWYAIVTGNQDIIADVAQRYPARTAYFDDILAGELCFQAVRQP